MNRLNRFLLFADPVLCWPRRIVQAGLFLVFLFVAMGRIAAACLRAHSERTQRD